MNWTKRSDFLPDAYPCGEPFKLAQGNIQHLHFAELDHHCI